jgi:hypothetical protein
LEVTAVVPASVPSKAAITPTTVRATISAPMTHIQMGILCLGVDGSAGERSAEAACTIASAGTVSWTGGGGVTPTGRRRAVHARPFQ